MKYTTKTHGTSQWLNINPPETESQWQNSFHSRKSQYMEHDVRRHIYDIQWGFVSFGMKYYYLTYLNNQCFIRNNTVQKFQDKNSILWVNHAFLFIFQLSGFAARLQLLCCKVLSQQLRVKWTFFEELSYIKRICTSRTMKGWLIYVFTVVNAQSYNMVICAVRNYYRYKMHVIKFHIPVISYVARKPYRKQLFKLAMCFCPLNSIVLSIASKMHFCTHISLWNLFM